jgi:hypothetical protein
MISVSYRLTSAYPYINTLQASDYFIVPSMSALGAGTLVQYSVFVTSNMKGAYDAVDLVKPYKGDALLFKRQHVLT